MLEFNERELYEMREEYEREQREREEVYFEHYYPEEFVEEIIDVD